MKVGVFHPGTQHSWQTALALQRADKLAWFVTSLFYKADRWPYKIECYLPGRLGERVRREFSRIAMPQLDSDLVHTVGILEWMQRIANRAGLRETARFFDAWGNRTFIKHMASYIASPEELAIWGYSGSSSASFEYAKRLGRPLILDRTIGDHRAYNAMMADLQEDFGDWFIPFERKVPDWVIASDDQEYELADHILVGSRYVADTIEQWSPVKGLSEKIRVLDYCFSESHFADALRPAPRSANGPVRFLFLGLVTPRKGIHHVLEAISELPRSEAELTIVGDMKIPPAVFAKYADRVTYFPTVPRYEVANIMAEHDVLLLPSYHEGAPLTLYEALASGMGIIQSQHSALIATQNTGIVLDRLDTESLLAAMRIPIEDRSCLEHWRASAQAEADRYSFAQYCSNIASFLDEVGI